MKNSVFLYSYSGMYEAGASTQDVIRAAAAHGFSGVEPYPEHDLNTVEEAAEIGKFVRDMGMEIPCFSMGYPLLDDLDKSREEMKQKIDMAAAMGSPKFHHTIHPYLNPPALGQMSFAKALKLAAPLLRELCLYAESKGVTCMYEDQGFYFNGVSHLEMLEEALDGVPFGYVADLGNIMFVDETPEVLVGKLSNRISHVHYKDYLKKSGSGVNPGKGWYTTQKGDFLRDTIVGHGDVNFISVLRILRLIGYDGWFSLEYAAPEPMEMGILQSFENIRRFYMAASDPSMQKPLLDGVLPKFE